MNIGCTERVYRLKQREGKFAWIWDDNGEFASPTFNSREDAVKWTRYGNKVGALHLDCIGTEGCKASVETVRE